MGMRPKSQQEGGSRASSTVRSRRSSNNGGGPVGKTMVVRRSSAGVGAPIGIAIGSVVLSRVLGEGTFGQVRLGNHKPTGEKVAAKVLVKGRIKTIADVKRVSREIRILKRVSHTGVIQLYEVIDTPTAVYFITEHCDGGELFDFIVRHQRLLEPQACYFYRQLIEGLDYLHRHDVTHRDLKPENLLLQSSRYGWRLKIIDFGLSNTHEGGRMLSTACGSPCYAAPEMIAGKKYFGPSADIWSAGVVLFTLIAGYLPFEDPSTGALYKKILAGNYAPPTWASLEARNLLSLILNTDPNSRADVNTIRTHPWFQKCTKPPPPPIMAPTCRDEINSSALARMVDMGMAEEEVCNILLSGKHCDEATSYYLILKSVLEEPAQEVGGAEGANQVHSDSAPTASLEDFSSPAAVVHAAAATSNAEASAAEAVETKGASNPSPVKATEIRAPQAVKDDASREENTASAIVRRQPSSQQSKVPSRAKSLSARPQIPPSVTRARSMWSQWRGAQGSTTARGALVHQPIVVVRRASGPARKQSLRAQKAVLLQASSNASSARVSGGSRAAGPQRPGAPPPSRAQPAAISIVMGHRILGS